MPPDANLIVHSTSSLCSNVSFFMLVQAVVDLAFRINRGVRTDAISSISRAAFINTLLDLVLGPLSGGLSDRIGRKPILVVSALVAGLGWLLVSAHPSNLTNMLARVVGYSFLSPSGSCFSIVQAAALSDSLTEQPLAIATSRVMSMMGVGMVVGPAIGGVLAKIDPTLRLTFAVAGSLQCANSAFLGFVLPETHILQAQKVSEKSPARLHDLLRQVNPLRWLQFFQHGKQLATFTLAVGFSQMAEFEKELKAIFRQEVLKWSPLQSARFLSLQGLSYFIGPLLTQPLLRAFGSEMTSRVGHMASVVEHCLRGFVLGPGALGNALTYAAIFPGTPGNIGLRLAPVRAALTAKGAIVGIPRGELAAATQNFANVLRLFAPLVYYRVYMSLKRPGRMWFVAASMSLCSLLLLSTFSEPWA